MDVICSIGGSDEGRCPRNRLNMFRQAGFSESVLDFNWFNECIVQWEKWEETMDNWRDLLNDWVEEATRQGIHFKIAVAPHFKKEYRIKNAEKRKDALVKEYIRYAGKYGCKFIVIPSLESDSQEKCIKVNRDFYLSLAGLAKDSGITILLRNSLKNHNGHYVRGFFSEPVQTATFIDELNEKSGAEVFGFCLDVGSCNMVGQDIYFFVVSLKSRLKALYLYENDGFHYNRLMPFFAANDEGSQFDWFNLIGSLRGIGFNGMAVVDFSTTLSALPKPLYPAMLRFAYELTEYLARQSGTKYWERQADIEKTLDKYPTRVLFGAGNMSRDYMERYGEKYPPRYVCDNNPKLWGTEFCGLRVHSPDDLKLLPEDCAVFVCNAIYYQDIEQQLSDMGIKNPVARFGDEYTLTNRVKV